MHWREENKEEEEEEVVSDGQEGGTRRREGDRLGRGCWCIEVGQDTSEGAGVLVKSTEEFERVKFESFGGKVGEGGRETDCASVVGICSLDRNSTFSEKEFVDPSSVLITLFSLVPNILLFSTLVFAESPDNQHNPYYFFIKIPK